MNLPKFSIRMNLEPGNTLQVKVNFYKHEFHNYMQPEDFDLMEQALLDDPNFYSIEGQIMDGCERYFIEAAVKNRLNWMIGCRFLDQLDGKWLFNSRRYCRDANLPYESSMSFFKASSLAPEGWSWDHEPPQPISTNDRLAQERFEKECRSAADEIGAKESRSWAQRIKKWIADL